jgi:pilus assembly protein CpaB
MQLVSGRRTAAGSRLDILSNRKPLLVALVLGLLAAFLSWSYLQSAGQRPKEVELVPVLVAAADIPVRTEIRPDMLAVKQVTMDARHARAFTAFEQVNGKITSLPIAAGEQVLNTKFFARKEDSGLAFRIPPGKRAVSVNVSEVVTTGGLIVPGDFVDVLALFDGGSVSGSSSRSANAEQASASTVLENIEVLAVAQTYQTIGDEPQGPASALQRASSQSKSNEPAKQEAVARPGARTATLAVSPDEAQVLILAEQRGTIRLALRGVEDHAVVGVSPTRIEAILR